MTDKFERKPLSGKWGPLIILSMAMFILIIDMTMMNVAISAVARDLHTTVEMMRIAIVLYALIMAAFMITGGKLGDIYGTKRILIIGTLAPSPILAHHLVQP